MNFNQLLFENCPMQSSKSTNRPKSIGYWDERPKKNCQCPWSLGWLSKWVNPYQSRNNHAYFVSLKIKK